MSTLVNKVFNKLHFLLLTRRIGKLSRHPQLYRLVNNPEAIYPHSCALMNDYQFYVNNISRADMAASLELISLTDNLCKNSHYKKLLDLGSGFSSFALRNYARTDRAIEVWSVDDNEQWIEKTRQYLNQQGITDKNLMILKDFLNINERNFDLVFLDLNFVEVRKAYIQLAIDRCRSGGIIIFDDVHKSDFLFELLKQTKGQPVKLYDLKDFTTDQFGRYALLGVKD